VLNTCWWFHPCTVCNTLVGWSITWTRLEPLITVGSFLLSGQLDESQSIFKVTQKIYFSIDIAYIIKQFTHYPDTDS
jgi:hypothetical protein